jgi:hypothetical protein
VTTSRTAAFADPMDDATGLALRLALGTATSVERFADWERVFAISSRELLAPLAWLRSGPVIRANAPPAVVRPWRRAAIAAHLRGQQQLELLRDAMSAFQDRRVGAVVLKGLPLGETLYGDPFVRCCADIDLHVPSEQRAEAAAALTALGWRHLDGNAPWHETWSIWRDDTAFHLELHSSLVSDHLAHLRTAAPTAVTVSIAGERIRAHAGAFVAPYLATHLATHQMPPLLWLVDFATLWQRSSATAREQAERVAQTSGVHGYLAWAKQRARLIEPASRGDRDALGSLGFGRSERRDMHSIWRHFALQPSWADRLRLVAAFAVPRASRGSLLTVIRYGVARLRTRLSSLAGVSRSYAAVGATAEYDVGGPANAGPRPFRLGRADLVALAGDVVGAGAALWVRAPGGSMLPTIPRGSLVRIDPVPSEGIEKGDVVLSLTADGEPVIHRVVAISDAALTTRGDAAIHTDPPVPFGRVIGLATAVRDAAGERRITRRARRSMAVTVLKLRRRVARVVLGAR